ncbi:MAG: hypothetical protein M3179_05815 [Actinomycetota bacterium]|nr:hypothetical protein [Actinomycetota bacterium]
MPTRETRGTGAPRKVGVPWYLLLIVPIAAAIIFWGWLTYNDDSAGPERGVAVDDVAESDALDEDGFTDSWVGQQVTVSGNVSEMVGQNAIRLGGDDFGGDGILVIEVTASGITEDDDVRVTGTVRDFDAAAFERELGTDVYEDDLYDRWEDEVVLVASNVTELSNGD